LLSLDTSSTRLEDVNARVQGTVQLPADKRR
jgi:hypothetical protein